MPSEVGSENRGLDRSTQETTRQNDYPLNWRNIAITLTAARSYDLIAFASCERARELDTTKVDLLFLPCKLADDFAATIKELQD